MIRCMWFDYPKSSETMMHPPLNVTLGDDFTVEAITITLLVGTKLSTDE